MSTNILSGRIWGAGQYLKHFSGMLEKICLTIIVQHIGITALGSEKDDAYIIKCFDYIEWDMDLIEKMENSLEYLKENVESRTNSDSRGNGNSRIATYEKIIKSSKDKIEETCKDNDIELEKFSNINELLK